MKRMMILIATSLACLLAGCDGERPIGGSSLGDRLRIDPSSPEALVYSLNKIRASLPSTDRKQFDADCAIITGPERMKAVHGSAYSGGKPPTENVFYKRFTGFSAEKAHERAEEYRANDQKVVEEEKKQHEKTVANGLTHDPETLVEKARQGIKTMAAAMFGEVRARQSLVNANHAGLKRLGDDTWEVKGDYLGSDRDGADFKRLWTVKLTVTSGKIECSSVEFRPWNLPAAASAAAPAPKSLAEIATEPPPRAAPAPNTLASAASQPPAIGGRASRSAATSRKPGSSSQTPNKGTPKKSQGGTMPKTIDPAKKAADAVKAWKLAFAVDEAGQSEKALEYYQAIVRDYPGTPEAEKASDRADVMLGKPSMSKKK